MVAARKSLSRSERAAQTRARMIDAAFDSFSQNGYQGTTMAGVAKAAGVAEQTMYFTFGSKASLLHEVMVTKRGAPDEPTDIMERAWVSEAVGEPDQRRVIAIMVENGTEIFRRLAPIADAMTAAGLTDPAVADALETIAAQRRQGMSRLVTVLAERGRLATSAIRAVDVIDVVQSMSTYNAFCRGCGWSTEEYKAWAYRTITQILPQATPAKARALDAAATRGFGFHERITGPDTTQTGRRSSR